MDLVPPHAWGVAVGNLRTDIEAEVSENEEMNEYWKARLDAGELMGGSWSADLWEPSSWASHIAVGAPTTDWVLELDEDDNPLETYPTQDLENGLLDGVYMLRPIYMWDFENFFG